MLLRIDRLLKLRFTLFGLPFALSGALLPFALGEPVTRLPWIWIVLGFLFARTAGMACNELIDCQIDARNPRTMGRVLPQGELRRWQVGLMAAASLLGFFLVCHHIGGLAWRLAPLPAALIVAYSFTKRFTAASHFVLGFIECLAPVMAFVAVTNHMHTAPWLLGCTVLCSIAAKDALYARQDLEFDRREGLHSLPVLCGLRGTLIIARLLHGIAFASLLALGLLGGFGPLFFVCVASIGWILVRQHILLLRHSSGEFPPHFFAANATIALLTLLATIGAVLWRMWS